MVAYARFDCMQNLYVWHHKFGCNSMRTLNCAGYGVGQFFKDRFFVVDSPLVACVFRSRSVSWRCSRPPENSSFREKILWYPGPVTWTMSTLIIQPLFEQSRWVVQRRVTNRLSKKSFVGFHMASRDFVARGRPLCGQTRLAPLAKRSTCSKSRLLREPKNVLQTNLANFYLPRLIWAH